MKNEEKYLLVALLIAGITVYTAVSYLCFINRNDDPLSGFFFLVFAYAVAAFTNPGHRASNISLI